MSSASPCLVIPAPRHPRTSSSRCLVIPVPHHLRASSSPCLVIIHSPQFTVNDLHLTCRHVLRKGNRNKSTVIWPKFLDSSSGIDPKVLECIIKATNYEAWDSIPDANAIAFITSMGLNLQNLQCYESHHRPHSLHFILLYGICRLLSFVTSSVLSGLWFSWYLWISAFCPCYAVCLPVWGYEEMTSSHFIDWPQNIIDWQETKGCFKEKMIGWPTICVNIFQGDLTLILDYKPLKFWKSQPFRDQQQFPGLQLAGNWNFCEPWHPHFAVLLQALAPSLFVCVILLQPFRPDCPLWPFCLFLPPCSVLSLLPTSWFL